MSTQATVLSERADGCLTALDDADRAIARRMFLRLVSFEGGSADTPRQQPLSELGATEDPQRLAAILRRLTDAQLLLIGSDGSGDAPVGLADASLISSWPTLQAWIRTHGKAEQLRRQLETDAATWRQSMTADGGGADLLDKAQLREMTIWLATEASRDLGVSEVAASFLAASRAAARRWPGQAYLGSFLAISLMLMILATPIILLFVVVLSAWVIHRLG
jgi:hypothetical protein